MSSLSLNLHAELLQFERDGQSVFSMEQLSAVTQILNAHQGDKNFEADDCHSSCGEDGCILYCDSKQSHLLAELPPELMRDLKKDGDREKLAPCNVANRSCKVYRRGFWLADGPGFGKTRILAGVMIEYTYQKIWRVVYFSKSPTSCNMFKAEVERVGFTKVEWHDMSVVPTLTPGRVHVLLVQYGILEKPEQVELLRSWMGKDYTDLVRWNLVLTLIY